MPDRGDITRILHNLNAGDPGARDQLMAVVYDQLRRLASAQMRKERADHTLQPTALVHEACVKLLGGEGAEWANRAHFFGAAAKSMRRILVDYARRRKAKKRGGDLRRIAIDESQQPWLERPDQLIALDGALQALSDVDERKGRIVELRFFGGLSTEETARLLEISERTVKRDWAYAKAFLYKELYI